MPNTKSAVRRVRRVKKQTKVNRIRKSKYKNTIKIGFAYSIQKIKMIPIENHDISMDVVITEKAIYNK